MLTMIVFSGYVDTERQDRFLKEAIERMMDGSFTPKDVALVSQTFKARFDSRNMGVSIENQRHDKQPVRQIDENLNPF